MIGFLSELCITCNEHLHAAYACSHVNKINVDRSEMNL